MFDYLYSAIKIETLSLLASIFYKFRHFDVKRKFQKVEQ